MSSPYGISGNGKAWQLSIRCGFTHRSTSAARAYLALIGRCTRCIRHCRRSLRALTGIIVPFGAVGPSASVRYGFALRGFCRLCLPRTHRVLRSLLPPQAALTPYSTGRGHYRSHSERSEESLGNRLPLPAPAHVQLKRRFSANALDSSLRGTSSHLTALH